MAYVNPKLQPKLDSLSPELRQAVLNQNVALHNLFDLIGVLDALVRENEGR